MLIGRPTLHRAARAAATVLALAGWSRDARPAPRPLVPIARFVEPARPATESALARGAVVTIADESRPTLSSGRARMLESAWVPASDDPATSILRIDVPADPSARWLFLRSVAPSAMLGPLLPSIEVGLHALRLGSEPSHVDVGRFATAVAAANPGPAVVAMPAVPLAARDVVTAPIAVPAGAVLTFAIGVESMAWTAEAGPVEFQLSVVDGADERNLYRGRLDPGRRPEDRRWVEARVPLDPLAGRTVRFRFETRPADGGERPSLPVWGNPVLLAPAAGSPHLLNVVLVSLDTLRAMSVGAYGAERDTTPRFDRRFAEEGALFEAAFTPFPHTLPAHLSLFSSLYPRTHGVHEWVALSEAYRTLTEQLHAAGWATAAFTEDAFVAPELGFGRGFELYAENKSANFHRPEGHAGATFRHGLDWMQAHADRPFFVFLHTYQVHFPYTPPPPYSSAFTEAGTPTDEIAADLLAYEQEVRYLDDELDAFIAALDASGLGSRTLLVVLADHGEEFLEHGHRYHGLDLYEETAHVPLAMRLPGVVPPGLRVPVAVSLVDVAPTILDLVGAPAIPHAEGESLVPLLEGHPDAFARTVVFAEAPSNPVGNADVFAVRAAGWSCLFFSERDGASCFDRTTDPREQSPVQWGGDDARLEEARAAVTEYRHGHATSVAAVPPASSIPDPEREEKLRALGYVE